MDYQAQETIHRRLAIAAFYAVMSFVMTFLNKVVMTSLFFGFPTFIMAVQMVLTVVVLEGAKALKLVKFGNYTVDVAKATMPASILFALHCYFSLYALDGMSVPMYTAVKTCTPLFTMLMGMLMLNKSRPNKLVLASSLLIVVGAIVAGMYDIRRNLTSYLYACVSIVFQCAYLTTTEGLALTSHYSVVELVYCNAFHGMVFFILAALFTEEFQYGTDHLLDYSNRGFYVFFVLVILCGVLLSLALVMSTVRNSALSTTVVGVFKAVGQTMLAYSLSQNFFHDLTPHPLNKLGLVINVAGCVLYTVQMIKQETSPAPSPRKHINDLQQNTIGVRMA